MELSQRRERLLRRLHASRSRAREALVLVEGVRAAGEARLAGAGIEFAVVTPRLDASEAGRDLRTGLETDGVDLVHVEDGELAALADTESPQGVLLVCSEPQAGLATVLEGASVPRLLVLDALQDPGNVGTLVRSAVAFGWSGVLALDGTGDPWGAKAVRASAGTVFRLPLVRCVADDALAWLEEAGIPVVVASAEGPPVGRLDRDFTSTGLALVLGNEGAGVRPEVREAGTATVAVPMQRGVESLNAGVAGSILMYELTEASE